MTEIARLWRRPVTVTKPIRGSLSSGTASESTCRIDSFTRLIRSLIGCHDLSFHPDELPLLAGEVALGPVEELLQLACALAPRRRRSVSGPLPEVVVVDLGHGGSEALLELSLGRLDVLALALQRARLGEVQLDRQDPDVACAHTAIQADGLDRHGLKLVTGGFGVESLGRWWCG